MDTLTIVLTVIGSLLGVGLLVFIAELISHFAIPTIRDRYPDPAHKGGASLVYSNMYLTHIGELPMSQRFDEEKMQDVLKEPLAFVNHRQDCADFRLSVMLRLYRDFATELPVSVQTELKNAILGFRYWMTQPGQDSMCFWSENHQIIFASCEYMAGKTFPDQVFTVDGKTGVEHEAMAKARIEAWLDLRFTYGFSEWNSNNYFPETVTALLQLLSVTDDETLATRAKMVLDLLFFDVAQMGYQVEEAGRTYHTFIAPSARAYAHSKASDLAGKDRKSVV